MHHFTDFLSSVRLVVFVVAGVVAVVVGCQSESQSPGSSTQASAATRDHPNIVILMADDLGYADIGVNGAEGFTTPNLDRLADEGMRFTSFYAAESACSPTRASLLTGSYPLRAGIHDVLFPATLWGLNPDEVTFAELAKSRGYATAAVGKWHLGDHPTFLPTNHGFDSYFGIPYSNDMSPVAANNPWPDNRKRHPELPLVRDTTIIEREPDQSQLTKRYTEEAVGFIRDHQESPFLLYVAYTMPHVPLYASDDFAGRSERGLFGDVVAEIDWSVGRIVETLEEAGLGKSTLVFFTSDNGPWLIFGNHGGSAGPFREGKATAFEGGHRVPAVAWMPGYVEAGAVTDRMATTMDILPTVAGLIGADVPSDRVIDGQDIRPILTGDSSSVNEYEAFFFYRAGKLEAVRSGKWKLHVPHEYLVVDQVGMDGQAGSYERLNISTVLYNLEADPGETTDVSADHPEVVERLAGYVNRGRAEIGDYLTKSTGSLARPPAWVDESWGQNPLPNPDDRVSLDPAQWP